MPSRRTVLSLRRSLALLGVGPVGPGKRKYEGRRLRRVVREGLPFPPPRYCGKRQLPKEDAGTLDAYRPRRQPAAGVEARSERQVRRPEGEAREGDAEHPRERS